MLWTTAVGYILAAQWGSAADGAPLPRAPLIGTALAAACANTLNQVLEVEARRAQWCGPRDGRCHAGLITPRHATVVMAIGARRERG